MKIGILTFHRADNYGAVLQCYALFNAIKSLGYNDVHIIDYWPSYFKEQYSLFSYKKFLSLSLRGKAGMIKELVLFYIPKLLRRKKFSLFVNNLYLSPKMDESCISFEGYDIVFVGSDQVWNKSLTQGLDDAFSGIIRNDHMLLASYAASTDFNDNISNENEYYKGILKRFDFVSVREKVLANYFNSLVPGKAQWVLDPTLLLSSKQWKNIAVPPKDDNYLLIYTVPTDPAVMKLANIIAKARGLKIVELVSKVRYVYNKNCRQNVSPQEFLGYFHKARYVVTTSFHGTAFSIIMKKQFSTLMLGRSVDNRAKDLLSNIGLEDRLIDINDLHYPNSVINYECVDRLLKAQIDTSYNYIKSVIDCYKK